MRGRDLGLPVAVGVGVLAAGAATLLLRPRGGLIQAAPASAQAYFSPAELDRIHHYVGPQRIIGLGGLALTGGALALVALRPPRPVRRALERASARPLLGSAAAGAGLSAGLALVGLPLAAAAHARAHDYGLSTQSWGPWAGDAAKSGAISAAFSGGGALLLVALMRRFPRRWWLPGGVAAVVVGGAFTFLAPIALDPLFNSFTPLGDGRLRHDVLDLGRRADVRVGKVYRVDASRRTTGANAYVGGLGATKRVVLYDNLIENYMPAQVRSVVAHELGHVKDRDVQRGLLWLAIAGLPATLVAQRLTERLAPGRRGRADATVLPAAALSIALVSFAAGIAGNALSRRVESHADAFALRLTHDPKAFIEVERKLATDNLIDPDPPAWLKALFGTHPPTLERIGYALTYERGN